MRCDYIDIGNYAAAFQQGNAALQLAGQLNFKKEIARANHNIGLVYNAQGSYDKALEYFFVALKIREAIGDTRGMGSSYIDIGNIYNAQGSYDKALENYLASLKRWEETGNKKGIAATYNNIGQIYGYKGDYNKALENYLVSLKMWEETGDKKGIADLYNNIGDIYNNQGSFDKALEYFLVALKMQEKTGDKKGIAMAYNNIGDVYKNKGNYDKALENNFASLKIREQLGDKQGIAESFGNIGDVYKKKGKTDEALENYFASLKLFEELGDKRSRALYYIAIATIYTDKSNYNEASVWLQKGLQLAKEIGSMPLLLNAYKGLSVVSEKMNDYRNAYNYHQLYSKFKDSIFNEKSNKQITEMQTKYEVEKKDRAIEMQSLQLSKQQLQLTQNKILQVFLFVGILFIIIIAFILYNRTKIKQRELLKTHLLEQQKLHTKAIIETQEQERTRIARDLHDGIGQTLAGVIANYEELNAEIINFSEEKQKKFHHTAKSLDEVYKELRAISHLMMPRALKVVGLSAAISDLLDKTLAHTSINYSLAKTDPENISESIAIGIYRIFQELLGNILKHSQADKISVQLFNNQNQLILIVEDNGIGIPHGGPGYKNTGIGLINITARAQAMQGTFIIEPGAVKGTVATVIIPLTDPIHSIVKQPSNGTK